MTDSSAPRHDSNVHDFDNDMCQKVPLIIPPSYRNSRHASKVDDDDDVCFLELRGSLLHVIASSSRRTLDVMDTDDLLGAEIDIQMNVGERTTTLREPHRDLNEPPSDVLKDTTGSATLILYVYPRQQTFSKINVMISCGSRQHQELKPTPNYTKPTDTTLLGPRYFHPRYFRLQPSEDLRYTTQLLQQLCRIAHNRTQPEKYLIILNPFSGKKHGTQYWRQHVQPMLRQARVEVTLLTTTHPHHAYEAVQSRKDLGNFDGIVLIGGDGIVHEVFNGLQDRSDHKEHSWWRKLKIGIVGSGSCNGFATTVAHHSREAYGPLDETFIIAKNRTVVSDLSLYNTQSRSYISHLTFSWAIIADIDIESECLRWLGEPRVDIWAVWRVLCLRKYRGRLSYLPANQVADKSQSLPKMPSLDEPIPSDWVTVEDDFALLWVSQVTHAAMHTYQAPQSTMNDGVFHIMMVRGPVWRYQLARVLLGLETASHVRMAGVEFIQCTAYRLEPLSDGSFNDLDGEVIENGPVQAHVLPQTVSIFCRRPD